jgi:hypothetical protein
MAAIRSAYIERYTRALNAVSKRAQDALMRLLSSIPDSMWTDDYALARDLATEYIIESCGLTAQAAGQCADDFYEGLRVAQLGKVSGVDAEPDFDEDALRGEIDRYMEDAANGDIEAFRSGIASQVDYTAKRSAGSMVM